LKVNINGLDINYDVKGEGKSILLLHGWGCSVKTMSRIADNLGENFKVYNLDLPGFGMSDEPERPFSVKDFAETVKVFMEKLNIDNPILIGHSLGGRISIYLESMVDVKKIILVASAGIKDEKSKEQLKKEQMAKGVKRILQKVLGNKSEKIIDMLRNKVGTEDYKNSSKMMKETLKLVVNEDLRFLLKGFETETLLIWGENDTATPLRHGKEMERLIKGSGLVVFENCGHYMFLENEFLFLKVINNFLGVEQNDK
jgi:pimeloyl-ACP methyl ester carboxylesterase